jgi:hypothetical protein
MNKPKLRYVLFLVLATIGLFFMKVGASIPMSDGRYELVETKIWGDTTAHMVCDENPATYGDMFCKPWSQK